MRYQAELRGWTHPVKYCYYWLHVPTGETGVQEKEFRDRSDFIRQVDAWNDSSTDCGGYWLYSPRPFDEMVMETLCRR